MRLVTLIWLFTLSAFADTVFYVDANRTSNGDGSAANPWKLISDINWTTVSNATLTAKTTLYFSSRATWSPASQVLAARATGNATYRFLMIGDEQYNTNATGTAVWNTETNGYRATISNQANFVVYWTPGGMHHFTLKGFYFDSPLYAAVFLGWGGSVSNIYEVSTINCACGLSTAGHGYAGDYYGLGCSNILVSGCQFSNTIGEAIYMGAYDDLNDSVPGIIVESNLLVNCGQPGHEGEIDIKPPCYGAIVRYNTCYHTNHSDNATLCGVACAANNCQIYGNIFHGMVTNSNLGWGCGIYLNSDGDASTGKVVTACLIYNNLIYDCEQSGIKIGATTSTAGADVSGVKIWNNTIIGNWKNGCDFGASGGRTVTIAEFKNNLLVGNTNTEFAIGASANTTLTDCDYNLYSRTTGNSFTVALTGKTWAQWQALGYDAHGLTNAPLLNANYSLSAASPARGVGTNLSADFTTDITHATRSVWDIGAYAYISAGPQTLNAGSARVGTLRSQ